MKTMSRFPLELIVLVYFLSYLPNVILTKLVTTQPDAVLGRAITGLETLPASLIVSLVTTYLFIWLAGWHRDANQASIGGMSVPVPTKYTFLSGIGTALVLFTVPLSFTIPNVSIPFMQLLMRGDVLLVAPLVDLAFGRRVRWWSWAALGLVAVAMLVTITDRGGLKLPPIAIATILLYTLGYFTRLAVMTKVSKTGDAASVRKYFVEEKIVALPLSILALALLSVSGIDEHTTGLYWGFIEVWTRPEIVKIALIGVTLTIVSIFAIVILLHPSENSYCVPLERAASLVAGVGGAVILAWVWDLPMPSRAELTGAAILIAAIALLSIAPRTFAAVREAKAEER